MKLVSKIFRRTDWYITGNFGYRTIGGVLEFHNGTDYGTHKQNWDLYAVEQGVVTSCGTAVDGAKYIWVDYPRIGKKLLHYHLDRIDVSAGQEVKAGALLGCAGETGSASGVHLHLGMQPSGAGSYEDPHAYEYRYPIGTMNSDATVYGGPNTTIYAPIGSVIKQGKVEVLDKENEFFYIRYWTNKGLLKRGFVSISQIKNSSSISVEDVTKTFKGNNNLIYPQSTVYSDPNMATAEIGTVFENEGVTQFSQQENGCYLIEYSTPAGTKRGYVQGSELIQKEGGLAISTYGAEIYHTPRFEYKAGAVYAGEYVTVLQSSGTVSYIEYNTKNGRKRGYVTNGSIQVLDTGDVPALPNYTEESHKTTNAMTVYFGPSDKYAVAGSIGEGEIVTRLSSPILNANNYSFVQYATADGAKRGYVVASGLVPYVPPIIDPDDRDDRDDDDHDDQDNPDTNRYFTINEDGSVEYRWYELTSLFGTLAFESYYEADTVLPDEYYPDLLRLIDVMNTKKGAYIVLDTVALETLINYGYNNYVVGQNILGTRVHAFKPHKAFVRLCELYQFQTDALLWENYAVLYNESVGSPKRQRLLANMYKSALLMEMISRHDEVKRDNSSGLKVLDQFPGGVSESLIYSNLYNDARYTIGSGENRITVHEFDISNRVLLSNELEAIAQSMYRNKVIEITKLVTLSVIENIISEVISSTPAGPIAALSLDGVKLAYDVYNLNAEIDTNNDNVNAIIHNVNLSNNLFYMKAGATIASYKHAVTAYNVSVREWDLQIALCLYNDARSEERKVDRRTLLTAFYSMIQRGIDRDDLIWHFVNWCSGKAMELDKHGYNLMDILAEYRDNYTGCPYKNLSELSPDQIIELHNKYKDSEYPLVLTW